jgi:hypothetical protein
MVVAGFIAPDHIWDTVIDEWRKIIQNPKYPTRLRCFHATECVNGEDEVKNWTFADRLGLWGELVDLLIDSSLVGVGTVMNCEHYNRLDDAMKARLHSSHHFLVEAAIQFGIGVARNESDYFPIGPAFERLIKNIENIGGIYEDAALKQIADQIRKREDIPL